MVFLIVLRNLSAYQASTSIFPVPMLETTQLGYESGEKHPILHILILLFKNQIFHFSVFIHRRFKFSQHEFPHTNATFVIFDDFNFSFAIRTVT